MQDKLTIAQWQENRASRYCMLLQPVTSWSSVPSRYCMLLQPVTSRSSVPSATYAGSLDLIINTKGSDVITFIWINVSSCESLVPFVPSHRSVEALFLDVQRHLTPVPRVWSTHIRCSHDLAPPHHPLYQGFAIPPPPCAAGKAAAHFFTHLIICNE